jgi:hypothetical protein
MPQVRSKNDPSWVVQIDEKEDPCVTWDGRGIRSARQDHPLSSISAGRCNAQVAQLVEQRTENPCVGGSIPPLGTSLFNYLGVAASTGFPKRAPEFSNSVHFLVRRRSSRLIATTARRRRSPSSE